MMYHQLPQAAQVAIPNPVLGGVTNFASTSVNHAWSYTLPFDVQSTLVGESNFGIPVPVGGAAHSVNLITCAAAIYIYTNGAGIVHNVAFFHAHTGGIDAANSPTAAQYNLHNVAAVNIHVVFASSQVMQAEPKEGIQTAADGLFQILAAGVPAGNIRVITGTGTMFGVNSQGDVGIKPRRVWAHAGGVNGTLQQQFIAAVQAADGDYRAQFSPGQNTIGIFGSGHNKTTGTLRVNALNLAITAAQTDQAVINAMRTFLNNNANSYKAGSLKLFMVQRLYATLPTAPAVPAITTATAQLHGANLLTGIEQGDY